MTMLFNLAAAGVWFALPLTGYWLFFRRRGTAGEPCYPPITSFALITAVGIAVWSAPLLLAMTLGVYRADLAGLAGWLVTLIMLGGRIRKRELSLPRLPRPDAWDLVLTVGLAGAGFLYLGFAADTLAWSRDSGVYANHAIYMAHHGRLDIPYPWDPSLDPVFSRPFGRTPNFYLAGYYRTKGAITVQFGHLYPVWLAQAFSTFGHHGLYRLNGVLAMLAVGVFYGVCRVVMGKPHAVVAALFLAFNLSQLWVARVTLTEIFTQLLIWAGLLVLTRALMDPDSKSIGSARWAGVLLAISAFIRIDSLLLLPLLFISHLVMRVLEPPEKRSTRVWLALYQTALPAFALAIPYYRYLSAPYYEQHYFAVRPILLLTGASFLVLLAAMTRIPDLVRPLAKSRIVLITLFVTILGLAAYAYWIRPYRAPFAILYRQNRPFPGHRSYIEDSFINLAQYLSPVVVWAGVAGWLLFTGMLLRRGKYLYLLPALVLVGALSALYLWNQNVSPIHYWAIRRFVPVIIPGFIFFGAGGIAFALSRLPSRLALVSSMVVIVFLSAFTIRLDAFAYSIAEGKGTYEQLRDLARRLPDDRHQPIVAYRPKDWLQGLYFAFDRPVVFVDLSSQHGQVAVRRWSKMQAERNKPALLLAQREPRVSGLEFTALYTTTLTRIVIEDTVKPLPDETRTDSRRVTLYEVTVVDKDVSQSI